MPRASRFNKCVFYALLGGTAYFVYSLSTAARAPAPPAPAPLAPPARSLPRTEPNLMHEDIKYILLWPDARSPLDLLGQGLQRFVDNDCEYQNCFVSADRDFFLDVGDFDAVVFNGKLLSGVERLPARRTAAQKYVFAAAESAQNYPVCGARFDGYFNWTWTYRLDSDVRWAYLGVRDVRVRRVGPAPAARWQPAPAELPAELRATLRTKSKAVAWFVSHCTTRSRREQVAAALHRELRRYGLGVDVYGRCGALACPRSAEPSCKQRLKTDYYFYLSFENSFDEDYVTEKLLTALQNNAVPIVYGGANYSRYLPPGSYLDARALGPSALAEVIKALIDDPEAYESHFRWTRQYEYRDTLATEAVCDLCAALNDEGRYRNASVHTNFREWWNPSGACKT